MRILAVLVVALALPAKPAIVSKPIPFGSARRAETARYAERHYALATWRLALPNVIGHSESLTSPYHRELYAPWRCQTHSDWTHADMNAYRSRLAALARSERVAISRAGHMVASRC